jgi:hypothetical protein
MLRVALLRVTDERMAMVVTIHHIATDGWSYPLIMREVGEIYSALLTGREPVLTDPAIRYADFAVWQRQYLQGETLARLERFWGEYLAGAEATELPGDRPRPARQSYRGAFHRFNVDAATTRRLRALSRDEAATLNMILSAGFCAALEKHAGTDDVVVGALFGSRTRPELEHVVGYFVNSAAIRLDLSGQPTFREAVRRARRVILDTDTHQDLPFEKVVELTHVERDPSRNPLFQVMYFHHTYIPQHGEEEGGMGDMLDAQPIYEENAVSLVDTGVSKLDLTMATLEFGDTLGGVVEYATDLYDAETVTRFCEHFVALLSRASAEPDRPLATIPVASADEERRLLEAWAHGPVRGHATDPIHRLFEAQAARTPDLAGPPLSR